MAMLRQLTRADSQVHNLKGTCNLALLFVKSMKAWIVFVLAVFLSAASAQVSAPVDAIFERLSKVEMFAFGPTGYAGTISQGEKDYKLILSRPSAFADFEKLLSAGNPQSKAYALVGIRAVNTNRFKELSGSLRDSNEGVTTQSGCIVFHEVLGAVLKRIEAGDYSARKSAK
jgi:hypothetical protein